ncbi:MAG: GH116 family glycosyl hydrolase [Thermoguttaceae bacterium]
MLSNDRINEPTSSCCSSANCSIQRRAFIKTMTLGAAAVSVPGLPAMAGPLEASQQDTSEQGKLVPANKKLDPQWVKSLFDRGSHEVYRGKNLEKIGMPIGGLCAGQLYLGGDGKLWHWDIFNKAMGTGDHNYAHPPLPSSPLEQGFAIEITAGGKKQVRALDHTGFSDISFCGEYPIGYVEYRDPQSPVTVSLEAFSPHVPLDTQASSLPATVMRYTLKNTSSDKVEAQLAGWLENAVRLYNAPGDTAQRRNRVSRMPALLAIHSEAGGSSGTIGAWPIVSSDRGPANDDKNHDLGTLSLALLEPVEADQATPALKEGTLPAAAFVTDPQPQAPQPAGRKLLGSIVRKLALEPGQEATATFLIAWHFPRLNLKDGGRFYASRFENAAAVAAHLAANFASLHSQTRLWHDTWYDSTLPYWFLDRTLLNVSILATATAHRFATGRFWGWEGVGCCEGTCTHVWHYAHAVARLFPELERDLRKRTDFGTAQDSRTGVINHRGEGAGLAVDGQAGCILRAYREHQMSRDGALLKELWPRIKLAMQCLIHMDQGEGLIEGAQHNTLDQPWFGKVAWLSSLYLAALRACEEMAHEAGDPQFAQVARAIFERGSRNLDRELFNGEYYYQIPDKDHVRSVGSHNGCEIDQVFGQSWAFQVGLGRILPEGNVKKALASLWKYNFAPDVGPFRNAHKPGRWYAMAGEAGLIMCTWPQGEAARLQQGYDYYFNECMNGFEYQAAGHMIWEGMVQEGLAVTRAVHNRYHPSRRNPWNEVECGDHYARSMASYGVFLAACGYEYHGPKRYLAFAPRLSPENFRAAFTTAEGWGTFTQKDDAGRRKAVLAVRWGKLALKTLALATATGTKPVNAQVTLAGKAVEARVVEGNGRATIEFGAEVTIGAGQELAVELA